MSLLVPVPLVPTRLPCPVAVHRYGPDRPLYLGAFTGELSAAAVL